MCSAPNVYMFAYILIGTHMVALSLLCSMYLSIATDYNTLSYCIVNIGIPKNAYCPHSNPCQLDKFNIGCPKF